jgi:hypothetical protein
MAKGQRRSNREQKKPKQPKPERSPIASLVLTPASSARIGAPAGRSERAASRNGHK